MADGDVDELYVGDGDVIMFERFVRLLNEVVKLLMSKLLVMLEERCWLCMMSL